MFAIGSFMGQIAPGKNAVGRAVRDLALLGIRGQSASQLGRHLRASQFSFGQLAANGVVSYVRYIEKIVWFRRLGLGYPLVEHWPLYIVAASILFLVLMTAVVIWQAKSRPWLLAGWGWYVVFLLPTAGFYVLGDFSIADRYTYFPSIGLLLMLVWSVPNRAGKPMAIGLIGALIGLVLRTRVQVETWRDSITLYRHAVQTLGPNDTTCVGLGLGLARVNQPAEAIDLYSQALRINPQNPGAHLDMALAFDQLHNYAAAVPHYQAALAAAPNQLQCSYNLGLDLVATGKPQEALPFLQKAVDLNPDAEDARVNLATAELRSGNPGAAIDQSRALLQRNPKLTVARNTLAAALARTGRLAEAKSQYQLAILNDRTAATSYDQMAHSISAIAECCSLQLHVFEEHWPSIPAWPARITTSALRSPSRAVQKRPRLNFVPR